eukprot:365281-Pyramimonas_sp.AAC.1
MHPPAQAAEGSPDRVAALRRDQIRVWSYNCESCQVQGRLEEILQLAASHNVGVLSLQGTLMTVDTAWEHEHFWLYPLPRSDKQHRDGCLIGVSKKLASRTHV